MGLPSFIAHCQAATQAITALAATAEASGKKMTAFERGMDDLMKKNNSVVDQLSALAGKDGWLGQVGEQMQNYIDLVRKMQKDPLSIDPRAIKALRDFISQWGGKAGASVNWNQLDQQIRAGKI